MSQHHCQPRVRLHYDTVRKSVTCIYIGILACKTLSVTVIPVNPCAKKEDNKRRVQHPTFTLNRTVYWHIPGQRSYHAQTCLGSPSVESASPKSRPRWVPKGVWLRGRESTWAVRRRGLNSSLGGEGGEGEGDGGL